MDANIFTKPISDPNKPLDEVTTRAVDKVAIAFFISAGGIFFFPVAAAKASHTYEAL